KFFNPIIGNLLESKSMETAYNLEKLEPILANGFDHALSKEEVYQNLLKAGIKISENTFDIYCQDLTGNTYYGAMNEYILRTAAISSDLDSRYIAWLSGQRFSREKLESALWVVEGPKGDANPLFLGYHNDEDSGNGFIHSFIKYRDRFNDWFVDKINLNPDVSCDRISNIIYETMTRGDCSKISNNIYKYKLIVNGELRFFIVEFNSITGEINEIRPGG
ncbi:MAG: hypothetical protein JW891_07125, partial [Candidatus Lokiarchaeota archaeon]|nr:hypothetical protein [Candidatus Lokiarchaeota archaeon]